jgi:2-aminoadipate transaminase
MSTASREHPSGQGGEVRSLLSDSTNCWRSFRMGSAREIAGAEDVSVRFSFDSGHPPVETHPVADLTQLATELLAETHEVLEYGSSPALRSQLASWVGARQGLSGLDARNVTLALGGTQAIALVVAAFLEPGDVALIEALTFPYANRFMLQRGVDVRRMELDRDGIVMESLERQLAGLRRDGRPARLLYTIPTYHLPTGAVLPLARRQRLLELAAEYNLAVLEDAVYSDLQYDGEPNPPSLLHLDRDERVVQIHSFSKILVPGLRLGWACGPAPLIDGLNAQRLDLGVSQWLSAIMARYLERGLLDPHIEELRCVLLRKRDLAIGAMREHCASWTEFDVPTGGFYLWVAIDERVDLDQAKQAAALRGVRFRADDAFVYAGGARRHFRIPFASVTDHDLVDGIRIVGEELGRSVVGHR